MLPNQGCLGSLDLIKFNQFYMSYQLQTNNISSFEQPFQQESVIWHNKCIPFQL
jgi:hypothetical protein